MQTLFLTVAALCLAASAAAASDDMTIVSKTSINGKPARPDTSYLGADHARMGQGEEHEMIMDLKSGTTTTLDNARKTYFTTTKADIDAYAAKMQEKMNDPEAQKGMAMMRGMADAAASTVEVTKTGKTRQVAGYHCEEWSIKMNQFTTMKECVTKELKYPAHSYEAFMQYGESMRKAMSGMTGGAVAKSGADLAEKMKAIGGFPVASSTVTEVMGQKTTVEKEVTSVSDASIPASTWEVPAGYTKIDNPMLKAFERRGRRTH